MLTHHATPDYTKLKLTPTEQRLFNIMADGQPHRVNELILDGLQGDEVTSKASLHFHLHSLRSKLREVGEDVLYQNFGNYSAYRRVRLLLATKSYA